MDAALLGDAIEIDDAFLDAPADAVRHQLGEYERGERQSFDLSVTVPDTFTGAVMEQLLAIPYGETRTYGEIAAALDTAPIAVGAACGRNPVPVVVPCHRVLRSDGGPGGVAHKRRLLAHEFARVVERG